MSSHVISVVKKALGQISPTGKIWVAYSGGLDSHVLLHALKALQSSYGFLLGALHVNHGLSVNADKWAAHCVQICRKLEIDCQVLTIQLPSNDKRNLEEIARNARYQAFRTCMEAGHYLAVAHHADDQAETFLLQLLRSSGTRGLSAMPILKALEPGFLWRPLLSISRDILLSYAHQYQLVWVEDDSNAELHFDRNYLRHQVMPWLKARWPGTAKAIWHSAKHCSEAELLLQKLALEDLRTVEAGSALDLSKLCLLSSVRRHNVLRFWLRQQGLSLPGRVHLHQFEQHFIKARSDANPVLCFANVQLRRYGDLLYALPNSDFVPYRDSMRWKLNESLLLPGIGKLMAEQTWGKGICRNSVGDANIVEIRFRQGGEAIQPSDGKYSRSLKKLLQEWKVPPWQRDKIPLLYINGKLAQVLIEETSYIAKQFAAKADEWGWMVVMNCI